MELNRKIFFIILGLAGHLFFFEPAVASPPRAGVNALGQEIFHRASPPEKDRLILVSFVRLTVEGEIVGGAAEYDDTTTERPADYLELYDSAGDLVAVSWFDRFGIERTAIDRGLLEEAGELEGVFVLLLEGHRV
ncbi:MAG: hypothetical protein HYV04_13485 [Deltaproteobacteria bacterium]|nr:hypothetical protein [Deltaproteobacteria bacterium]